MTEPLLKQLEDGCALLNTLNILLTRQHDALVSRKVSSLQPLAEQIEKSHASLATHTAHCRSQLARKGYPNLITWLRHPGNTLSSEIINTARSLHCEYVALALQCQQQRDTNRWLLEQQSQVCQLFLDQLTGLSQQRYDASGNKVLYRSRHKLSQS